MKYTCEFHLLRDLGKSIDYHINFAIPAFPSPTPVREDYDIVYTLEIEAKNHEYALAEMFRIFNSHHPADYRNRSMSVGDVVVIATDTYRDAYLCDVVGWKRIENYEEVL
jgi:hypothetical protein